MKTIHEINIDNSSAVIDGKRIDTSRSGSQMLTELYRIYVNDYPKFFKMDILCKLGFIASELLLQAEGAPRFTDRADRAVLFFNHSSSIQADQAFEATIRDRSDFFPSPSVFVYTLPNIVTGEIAIRNHYYGETNFIILNERDDECIRQVTEAAFAEPTTTSAIAGWIEAPDNHHFTAALKLITK